MPMVMVMTMKSFFILLCHLCVKWDKRFYIPQITLSCDKDKYNAFFKKISLISPKFKKKSLQNLNYLKLFDS